MTKGVYVKLSLVVLFVLAVFAFQTFSQSGVKEITVKELKEMREKGVDFQLIDVRERHEYEEANLNAELIPLGTILDSAAKIAKDKKVIFHCRSGRRSTKAIKKLEAEFGFTNLYNLKGGLLAYIDTYGLPE